MATMIIKLILQESVMVLELAMYSATINLSLKYIQNYRPMKWNNINLQFGKCGTVLGTSKPLRSRHHTVFH